MQQVAGTVTSAFSETVHTGVRGVNFGFALAVALAWNEAVKSLIREVVKVSRTSVQAHFVYAVATTVFAVVVYTLSKRFSPDLQKPQVMYAATK